MGDFGGGNVVVTSGILIAFVTAMVTLVRLFLAFVGDNEKKHAENMKAVVAEVKEMVSDVKSMIAEVREEGRAQMERNFTILKEVVGVIERTNAALTILTDRFDKFDKVNRKQEPKS